MSITSGKVALTPEPTLMLQTLDYIKEQLKHTIYYNII